MSTHRENVAFRKAGCLPGWEPCGWEAILGGIIIEGGVPTLVGGKKRWHKGTQKVFVTDAEAEEEYRRYEAETGKCGECMGERKVYWGWSVAEGARFKPCPKCIPDVAKVEAPDA